MDISGISILISLVVLAVVAALVFFVRKDRAENRLSPLAGLAFGFILAGILFGQERLLGYALMGIGVTLAVVDMLRRSRR
jgi:hypothetical protein